MRVLLVALMPIALVVGCNKETPHEAGAGLRAVSGAAVTAAPPPVLPTASAAPVPDELLEQAQTKTSLADVLALTKPLMAEVFNASNRGARLLTAWAVKRMTWKDVGVSVNETTVGKVLKDSDAEKGKRICVEGAVVQITLHKEPFGNYYSGIMGNDREKLFRFHAVQSTGEIVQMSTARFCGVVTGRYDYKNNGGATAHAVEVVGMFDLPENRPH